MSSWQIFNKYFAFSLPNMQVSIQLECASSPVLNAIYWVARQVQQLPWCLFGNNGGIQNH